MPAKSKTIDPDNPPLTAAEIRSMRPARHVLPQKFLDAARRRREAALAAGDHPPLPPAPNKGGRPKLDAPKRAVSIRLDAEVIERLKASGAGWQTRVNDMLRKTLRLKG